MTAGAVGSDTFRSLRHRNFRMYFIGQLVSIAGTWAQTVAQGWLVLELSDDSTLALGVVTALQTGPTLLFGLWGGLLADRLDKRRLIIACQAGMAVAAFGLAMLTLSGVIELWMVYVCVFVSGLCMVPDFPARQSFVAEVVPPDDLINAVSLNSAIYNAGRVVGPAIDGVLLATTNTGVCFAVNAVSYLCVLIALWRMDPKLLRPHPPLLRGAGQVRAGLRYAWATTRIRANIALMAVMGSIGLVFQVLLPAFAKLSLDGNEVIYSLLASATGVGAVLGALRLASMSGSRADIVVRSATLCGATIVITSAMPTAALAIAAFVPVGWFMITALSSSNAMLQLDAAPAMRGRVTALRGLMVVGGAPIGGLLGGWLSELFGPRWAIAAGGLATLVAALALAKQLHEEPPAHTQTPAPTLIDVDVAAN
jgi:MFS family permease